VDAPTHAAQRIETGPRQRLGGSVAEVLAEDDLSVAIDKADDAHVRILWGGVKKNKGALRSTLPCMQISSRCQTHRIRSISA
jgi:hypothetical protein